jgi:hypothetical protein
MSAISMMMIQQSPAAVPSCNRLEVGMKLTVRMKLSKLCGVMVSGAGNSL